MVAAVGIVMFLALSALLARYLAVENTERDDVLAVLRAEAGGDASGMIARIPGCARHPRLRGAGHPERRKPAPSGGR